jgi:mono/diheme cytochrome c family protein
MTHLEVFMRWLISIVIGLLIWIVVLIVIVGTMNWAAGRPGRVESAFMKRVKYWRVGDKNQTDPLPDTADTRNEGAEHFQHHCQICHGLDGQGTGVPIVERSMPPVANLASERVQRYTDGQLKWIIDNGIRFSGMPGWEGIVTDEEAWAIVRYIRHLPAKGSLGTPKVFQEAEEEHEHGANKTHEQEQPQKQPAHQHVQ